ncbi:cell division protein FtsL [Limoniibacter endophyticus]|uniref:Cell division protein FtsL n=1 Tax=Limoniibacter endophyticus TaxID=1565040 RepID=A0A8J3DJZ2_9HYPH|nr:hypothetical protein [Limoniibacter endophyticus]GHC75154.1 hypothetical protein GCM10010136_24660 [Limoniibacter endophyticus]
MLFRTSDIVLICAMVGAAAFTYQVKHQAEDEIGKIRKLETQISLERDSIDVLKADWSVLTQPSRLQRLAGVYENQLNLKPSDPQQFGNISDLPERPLRIEDVLQQDLELLAEGEQLPAQDNIHTGAISQ